MFDKFFNILNVSNYTSCIKSLKPFKKPYRGKDDSRINVKKWLKTEFLKWLDDWKEQIESRNDLDEYEKERRQISRETLEGIHITGTCNTLQKSLIILYILVYSFIDLIEDLFADIQVTSFLSQRIQQDPLEKYFGKQRQRGRVNENPTVSEYLKNEQALRVISSINLDVVKGNTRGTNKRRLEVEPEDYKPLKRRLNKKRKIDQSSTTINKIFQIS